MVKSNKDDGMNTYKLAGKIVQGKLIIVFSLLPSAILFAKERSPKNKLVEQRFVNPDKTYQKGISYKIEEKYYQLLVQSFLGANDLQNALRVLEDAVKRFPQNPKWWELYGQVLIWNNMGAKAGEVFYEGYKNTKNKELAQKAFEISLAFNRIDIAKELMEVVSVPPDVKVYIYDQLGDVEGLLKLLYTLKTKDMLLMRAEILNALGRKKEAEETINEYLRLYGKDERSVLLLANVYYSNKKFEQALKVLKDFLPSAKEDNVEFYRTLSDLAWMLQDYDATALASEKLINLSKGEMADYIKLSEIYFRKGSKRAVSLALEGYKKFEDLILLKTAFYYSYALGLYDQTVAIFKEHRDKLQDDVNIVFPYLLALQQLGKKEEALEELEKILAKAKTPELVSFYIYSLVEAQRVEKLKSALKEYETYTKNPLVAQAYAVAYIFLQKGQTALSYYKLSGSKDPLLYADIINVMGMEEEAKAIKLKAYRELKSGRLPWDDLEKLRLYLSLAMEFENPEIFERKLQRARGVLSDAVWKDIYFAYLFSKEQRERAILQQRLYKYPLKPWMWLNLALWQDDRYLVLQLLESDPEALPIRDRVEALRRVGQPRRALELAFKGLEENPYDYQLYKQFRDLAVQESNRVSLEVTHQKREAYGQLIERLEVETKLRDTNYSVGFRSSTFQPTYKKDQVIKQKVGGYQAEIYLRRRFDKGSLGFGIGQLERLRSVANFRLFGESYLFSRLSAGFEVGYRQPSTESLYLELGGLKNYAKLSLTFTPYNRLGFYSSLELSEFYSQDIKRLGTGFYTYNQAQYKLKAGYPDYTLRAFFSYGNYREKAGSKGVIEQLSPFTAFRVLPENYYAVGLGFSFGFEHKYSYTRFWRPFFDASLAYNSLGSLGISTEIGLGGAVFGRDNFSVGLSFSKNTGGTKESVIGPYLIYRYYFIHTPKIRRVEENK
jgi:polysaccharide biosynthesis protein PelB